MPTTSIDDVLATAHLPVDQKQDNFKSEAPLPVEDSSDQDMVKEVTEKEQYKEPESDDQREIKEPEDKEELSNKSSFIDEYGNESEEPKKKVYSEDEVNERINKAVRERLERFERKQLQENQHNKTQEPNNEGDQNQDWQQELKSFIRQTNEEMQQEQIKKTQYQREKQIQQEFESKFHQGMSKFKDFTEVVSKQPITDAMTLATRAMNDPAAFLYAASKRHPQEIERISRLQDPYTQMVEMGKLEERMKKSQSSSSAPRPLSRTSEDTISNSRDFKEPTIEDLIRDSESRRLSNIKRIRR